MGLTGHVRRMQDILFFAAGSQTGRPCGVQPVLRLGACDRPSPAAMKKQYMATRQVYACGEDRRYSCITVPALSAASMSASSLRKDLRAHEL